MELEYLNLHFYQRYVLPMYGYLVLGLPGTAAKLKNKSKNMIISQIEIRLPEQMNGSDPMFIASMSRQAFANTFVGGSSFLECF